MLLNAMLQVPVPLRRVIMQFATPPEMVTVPVGVGRPPGTLATLTATDMVCPAAEGSGASLVIVVVVDVTRSFTVTVMVSKSLRRPSETRTVMG